MTVIPGNEIQRALKTVDDAGFSIMLKPQWDNLQAWLNEKGWPPQDWKPRVSER